MIHIKYLKFKPDGLGRDGMTAFEIFPNLYGARVSTGSMYDTRPDAPYNIVIHGYLENIIPTSIITGKNMGCLTKDEANKVLEAVQKLPYKPQ
jgi:hypothetical protein